MRLSILVIAISFCFNIGSHVFTKSTHIHQSKEHKVNTLMLSGDTNHFLLHMNQSHPHIRHVEQEIADFFGSAAHYFHRNTYLIFASRKTVERFRQKSMKLLDITIVPSHLKLPPPHRRPVTAKLLDSEDKCPFHIESSGSLHLLIHLSFSDIQETEVLLQSWKQSSHQKIGTLDATAVSGTLAVLEVASASCKPAVDFLISQPAIRYLEPLPDIQLFMPTTSRVIQGGSTSAPYPAWKAGIQGQNQIIVVGDTGLDYYNLYFQDSTDVTFDGVLNPQHRKVLTYFTFKCPYSNKTRCPGPDGERSDVVGGHGTHVSGCAAGQLRNADPLNDPSGGAAPRSKLIFFDFAYNDSALLLPMDLSNNLFRKAEALDANARIHVHSWGSTCNAPRSGCTSFQRAIAYGQQAQAVDTHLFQNPESIVMFAAGNDGDHGAGSIASPANCKNALSVGASEKALDKMASFSSYGPTYDGRVKPEVVAPGVSVVAANSNGNTGQTTPALTQKSGTSMAAPAVAGAVALVRQYLQQGLYADEADPTFRIAAPSGALLKALMILSTDFMQTSSDASQHPPGQTQGWGRINLQNIIFPMSSKIWFSPWKGSQSSFSANGTNMRSDTYCFRTTSQGRLKVVLYWHDPACTVNCDIQSSLVYNDLDLTLHSGFNVWRGNMVDTYDHANNVEVVDLPSAPADSYMISVTLDAVYNTLTDLPFVVALMGQWDTAPSAEACLTQCPSVMGIVCSGAGTCLNGTCQCRLGYSGADCGTFTYPDGRFHVASTKPTDCSLGGCGTSCFDDDLNGHWTGTSCNVCNASWGPAGSCLVDVTCSGHGTYSGGTCTCTSYSHSAGTGQYAGPNCNRCADGWAGPNCDCNVAACSGHGSCGTGPGCQCLSGASSGYWVQKSGDRSSCQCAPGYFGPDCQSNTNCSGLGTYNATTGQCICKERLGGLSCDTCAPDFLGSPYPQCGCYRGCPAKVTTGASILYGCNKLIGYCDCPTGWTGLGCGCPVSQGAVCSGHGQCGTGSCNCYQNDAQGYWSGNCSQCLAGWGSPASGCQCPSLAVLADSVVTSRLCGHGTCGVGGCVCHSSNALGFWTMPTNAVGKDRGCISCAAGWVGPKVNGVQTGCRCQTPPGWSASDAISWETSSAVQRKLCSGHGTCTESGCQCSASFETGHWAGDNCNVCAPGWYGMQCKCWQQCGGFSGVCEANGCKCYNNTAQGFYFYTPQMPSSGWNTVTGHMSDCGSCAPGYTGRDANTRCLCESSSCYAISYDPAQAYPTPDVPIQLLSSQWRLEIYINYSVGALGSAAQSLQLQVLSEGQPDYPSKSAVDHFLYLRPTAFYLRQAGVPNANSSVQSFKYKTSALADVHLTIKVAVMDESAAKKEGTLSQLLRINYNIHSPQLLQHGSEGWAPASYACPPGVQRDAYSNGYLTTELCSIDENMILATFVQVPELYPIWLYIAGAAVVVTLLMILLLLLGLCLRRCRVEKRRAEAKERILHYLANDEDRLGKSLRAKLGLCRNERFTPEMAVQRLLDRSVKARRMSVRLSQTLHSTPSAPNSGLLAPTTALLGSSPELQNWHFPDRELHSSEAPEESHDTPHKDLKVDASPELHQKLQKLQMENEKRKSPNRRGH